MAKHTSSVLFIGGQNAVVFECRRNNVVAHLRVSACTDPLLSLATTHLCLFFVHSSVWLGADTTKMWWEQGQTDQTDELRGLFPFGNDWKSFSRFERRTFSEKRSFFPLSRNSEGPNVRLSKSVPASFQQVHMHSMMWNRDHTCELLHLIVQAIICDTKRAPQRNSNANSM